MEKKYNLILLSLYIFYPVFSNWIFFFKFPPFSLKIVVPETNISTPACIAIFEFSKLIPPSISIWALSFFASISYLKILTFSKVSGINFCPPNPGFTLITKTKSIRFKTGNTLSIEVSGLRDTPAFLL